MIIRSIEQLEEPIKIDQIESNSDMYITHRIHFDSAAENDVVLVTKYERELYISYAAYADNERREITPVSIELNTMITKKIRNYKVEFVEIREGLIQ